MRVLLGEVARDREQVRLGIANCSHVGNPQHAHIHLLGKIRRFLVPAHAPIQECAQRKPVLCEQPFYQRLFRFGHQDLQRSNRDSEP